MEGCVALPLRHNGVAYRGVNVLALWMQAMAKGYAAPVWMTFKQALALGANVRKGEKGSRVRVQCERRRLGSIFLLHELYRTSVRCWR
jgi:antirestriction protein ArdC